LAGMPDSDSKISNNTRCAVCGKSAIGIHGLPSPRDSGAFEHSPGVLFYNEHHDEALELAQGRGGDREKKPKL